MILSEENYINSCFRQYIQFFLVAENDDAVYFVICFIYLNGNNIEFGIDLIDKLKYKNI